LIKIYLEPQIINGFGIICGKSKQKIGTSDNVVQWLDEETCESGSKQKVGTSDNVVQWLDEETCESEVSDSKPGG